MVFLIRDLGSLNGTYVNRERVEEAILKDKDELQIGRYRLIYIHKDESQGDQGS
ncbi:FHA domain-containing protein [Candidatus Hakubella thermalkaliphila]|uniref:FHA domain-containing protein n=1 Tax=Candidatus Hakubella thermalkaliphila TaxID=2754717 RepID=UPI00387E8C32